jgi:hypothetical protein
VLSLSQVEGWSRNVAQESDYQEYVRLYGSPVDRHTGKPVKRSLREALTQDLEKALVEENRRVERLLSTWDPQVFYGGNLWMALTSEDLGAETTVPRRMQVAAGAIEVAPFAIAYRQQIAAGFRAGFRAVMSAADTAAERITASALARSGGGVRLGTFTSFGPVSGEAIANSESSAIGNVVEHVSPYQIRIEPVSGRGPMAIDTSSFTEGVRTVRGGVRSAPEFWAEWRARYSSTLSDANLGSIEQRRSPVVDDQWIRAFPEHEAYRGEVLIHHHLDQGPLAIPLPDSLHRRNPGASIWHYGTYPE